MRNAIGFSRQEELQSKGGNIIKDARQDVDKSSPEFAAGVEAGLNPTEGTQNWQAGIELGQELKDEPEKTPPVSESVPEKPSPPLFVREPSQGNRGSDQDEKDETEE